MASYANDNCTITVSNDYIRSLVPRYELGDFDCDEILFEVGRSIGDFVKVMATKHRIDHPRSSGNGYVSAHLTRQVWHGWHGDYAEDVGEIDFNAAIALDQYELSELPKAGVDYSAFCCGDDLFHTAVELGLVPDWDGPFECHITDEDEYQEYLEARKAKED
jgi:hypothetical protein